MPGMAGFEVLKLLEANDATKSVPVVLLSAHHSQTDVERAKSLGAADYIIKPFISDAVASHLQALAAGGAASVRKQT